MQCRKAMLRLEIIVDRDSRHRSLEQKKLDNEAAVCAALSQSGGPTIHWDRAVSDISTVGRGLDCLRLRPFERDQLQTPLFALTPLPSLPLGAPRSRHTLAHACTLTQKAWCEQSLVPTLTTWDLDCARQGEGQKIFMSRLWCT